MSVSNPLPTTELGAINGMLSTIGVAPLNTLSGTNTADVSAARNKLAEVSVRMQTRGWWFNSEADYPLARNVDGEINLAASIVSVDLDTTKYADIDVVQRGTRLYDRKNHTYIFTADLKADVVILLPYDELPEVARQYVYIRAGRLFQQETVGSETRDGFTEEDMYTAALELDRKEINNADHNIFDNYSVSGVLDRSPIGGRY